jgi:HSP20 family protein
MAILRWRPAGQAVERWDPFRDLTEIQSEMNRVFDGAFGRPSTMTGFDRGWAPAVDMYETKDELVLRAELPGMNEKDVSLSLTGDVLALRGERVPDPTVNQEHYFRGERWYGKFERMFPLPIPIEAEKVTATFRDGVLTVTLPKAEAIKPKAIKIDVM